MHFKPDWVHSKKRFEYLWHQEVVDRCCIAVFSPKANHEEAYHKGVALNSTLHGYEPEYVLEQKEISLENVFFGGEAFPELWFNYGPAGHAGYFNAPYEIKNGTHWTKSIINDYSTDLPKFSPKNEILKHQEMLSSYIAKKCKGRFMVSTPDNAGMLDALSVLRGTDNLLMDLYDNPNAVREALDKIFVAWNTARESLYNIAKECNEGGSVVGWLSAWAPGRMSQLQSDISVMLSNETFREFELPELIRCANSQEFSLYHMDGVEQIRHLDDILAIDNIQMIQWVSVAGQPNYLHQFETLRKIQKSGKSVLINEVKPADVKTILSELSPKGLFLLTNTSTQSDAEDLLESVKKWSKP